MTLAVGQVDISSKTVSSVTSVSGLGFAPAAVLFLPRVSNSGASSGGSAGSSVSGPGWGVLTGAAQFALSAEANAGTVRDRRHASGIVHDSTARGTDGGIFTGALTSDGFDLTCIDATGTNNILSYLAIGGIGVTATAGAFTGPSGAGVVSHNLGVRPHVLLHWTLGSLTNGVESNDLLGMGMVGTDLSQGCYTGRSAPGISGVKLHYCAEGEGFAYASPSSAALQARGVVTGFTSDGITVDWVAAASEVHHFLALRGVSAELVSLLTNASLNGDTVVSGLPWMPDGGIALGSMTPTLQTPGTVVTSSGIGAARQFSTGVWAGVGTHFGFSSVVHRSGSFDSHRIEYGTAMVAGYAQSSSTIDRYAISAVGSDSFTVRSIEADNAVARAMLMLALSNTAPVDPQLGNAIWYGSPW